MNLYGYVGGDPVNMIDVTGLWGVKAGFTVFSYDFSVKIYDTEKGWLPNDGEYEPTNISTTLFGGGLTFYGPQDFDSREEFVISFGLSKYLGFSSDPKSRIPSVNLGIGIGPPVSISTPMRNIFNGYEETMYPNKQEMPDRIEPLR